MEFEWGFRKADQNFRKHKVDFADAVIALEDINALTIEDDSHDERRFKTLALGPNLNVLLIIYAEHINDIIIRIIPARQADRSETIQYYRGLNR